MRIGRCLVKPLKDSDVVFEDLVGDDVFLNFTLDDGNIVLVDLNDLFDISVDFTSKQFFDEWHGFHG